MVIYANLFAHAHLYFRMAVSVNKNMYRYNDLSKLKKNELIEIARRSIAEQNLEVKSMTKKCLLDKLVEYGVCSEKSLSAPVLNDDTEGIELPVDLTSAFLQHEVVSDRNLGTVPYVSFETLYQYLCHGSCSMKVMDRAVKHLEAGDVNNLAMCQVCSCCVWSIQDTLFDSENITTICYSKYCRQCL